MPDRFAYQLPDSDPAETQEWIDSIASVLAVNGKERAEFLLAHLMHYAQGQGLGVKTVSTPYVNSIPTDLQPWFPGDEEMERRIRRFVRWNAAVMVVHANRTAEGIGGHLSTFASSAALYEVGFNHFFHGRNNGVPGDHVYLQGHAAPGIYARAYLEGRLTADQLANFRREIDGPGGRDNGLSSYPHPWLMPDFWEYPTVSMGLGPLNSIYQARFNRYLHARQIDDTSNSRVWCFVGDGECDEPETLGAISLAGREKLDNLTWVVNCNLQRLDGPVRGNGKIIQELESVFRGAGWNVFKVVWGSAWDDLLARDVDGVLLAKMNSTPDGDFQRYAASDGAHIREHFFGPDPRLRKLVAHLSDDELRLLPRGGHDYKKIYAAYRAAVDQSDGPSVVLAKTVKGWTLGAAVESRNATHQIKKMTAVQLRELRSRLHLEDAISDGMLEEGAPPPFYRPPVGSPEHSYLMQRRGTLGGPLPARSIHVLRPLTLPPAETFTDLMSGSGTVEVSTTTAFTRLLRNLTRDGEFGRRVVPIVADEARTFGMDALFPEIGIYASQGQTYEPVDNAMVLSYQERQDGQIIEEGITEAGSIASFTAAGTAYAHRGVPMVPFFTFYSMFGFQRVGDMIWAAADAGAKGFLLGATAGRTTLTGEGLQHQDGHSHVLASTVPSCQAYDPAFAYEMAIIIQDGLRRMYGGQRTPGVNGDETGDQVFYYLTLYNENYVMPARPEKVTDLDVTGGLYRWAEADQGTIPATILFSGAAHAAARLAQGFLAEQYDVVAELWSATSYKTLREEALDAERWNRLHPEHGQRTPRVSDLLSHSAGPIVAVTDYMKMVPDQIARFVPDGRTFIPLGTDGWGRSDTRASLRRFFEVDAAHVTVAVLSGLAAEGKVKPAAVTDAINRYGINPDYPNPAHL